MSKQEKRFKSWQNNTPVEARVEQVLSLIDTYIGKENRDDFDGSHIRAKHDKLIGLHGFGPEGEFHIPTIKGQKVKGFYIKKLIRIIEIITEDKEVSK